MKTMRGFTIVEIIVVITAVAILAAISTATYSNLQVQSRDSEREADVLSMKAGLETYYERNGEYPARITSPSNAELANAPSFYLDTLRVSPAALVSPSAASGTTSSWVWGTSAANSSQYTIISYRADGSQCTTIVPCTRYVITWRKEADNALQTVTSKFGN